MAGIRTSEIRLQGFHKALVYAGLKYEPKFNRSGDYRVAGGDAAMRSLMKEPRMPKAIMTTNDLSAFGILRALHGNGISVPQQMSVVGFDCNQLSDAAYPPLTTILVSSRSLVRACIKALDYSKANITRRGLKLSVRGSLIVRESTGIAPGRRQS